MYDIITEEDEVLSGHKTKNVLVGLTELGKKKIIESIPEASDFVKYNWLGEIILNHTDRYNGHKIGGACSEYKQFVVETIGRELVSDEFIYEYEGKIAILKFEDFLVRDNKNV